MVGVWKRHFSARAVALFMGLFLVWYLWRGAAAPPVEESNVKIAKMYANKDAPKVNDNIRDAIDRMSGDRLIIDESDDAGPRDRPRPMPNKKKSPLLDGKKRIEEGKKRLPLDEGKKNDLQWGGGWSERFKKEGVADKAEGDVNLLRHPLLARFSSFDMPQARADMTNLTVCAAVSAGDERFLSEWVLYHMLLGVERFALYDLGVAPSPAPSEEQKSDPSPEQREGQAAEGTSDSLESESSLDPDSDLERREAPVDGVGNGLGGGIDDVRDNAMANALPVDHLHASDGEDSPPSTHTFLLPAPLTPWIQDGTVTLHRLTFSSPASRKNAQQHMLDHCAATYAPTSNWLVHLASDEFLVYDSPGMPYQTGTPDVESFKSSSAIEDVNEPWLFPLHDYLSQLTGACVVVPRYTFVNSGLPQARLVLDTQTKRERDVASAMIVRPSAGGAFYGDHGCTVNGEHPDAPSHAPSGPLGVAHFAHRDVLDCKAKLAFSDTALCSTVSKDAHEDTSVRDAWAARAAKAVLDLWDKSERGEGARGGYEELVVELSY